MTSSKKRDGGTRRCRIWVGGGRPKGETMGDMAEGGSRTISRSLGNLLPGTKEATYMLHIIANAPDKAMTKERSKHGQGKKKKKKKRAQVDPPERHVLRGSCESAKICSLGEAWQGRTREEIWSCLPQSTPSGILVAKR